MRWLPLFLVSTSIASADPAPIHRLETTAYKFELKSHNAEIEAFRVVANTPVLTAKINATIARVAGIHGAAQTDMTREISCEEGLMTDMFVSWRCSGLLDSGTAFTSRAVAYFIEKDDLRRATIANVFVPEFATRIANAPGAKRGSESWHESTPCTPDPKMSFMISNDGITFTDAEDRCTVGWDVIMPLLTKGSILRRIIKDNDIADTVEDPVENLQARWAKEQPRFVVDKTNAGVVLDRATDLMWAARDNGTDIDHAAAVAFAESFRGGTYDDWRLPTDEELEELSDPAMAHREKADCTKGKNALLVTPLIRLSCGLAWSSTTSNPSGRPIAFGFISGTPRAAKPTEKKNYRALVVRDAAKPTRQP